MKAFHSGLAAEYDQLLAQRELELCAVLRAREEQSTYAARDDVSDFKDLATLQSEVAVDEVQAEHAAHELEQVLGGGGQVPGLTSGLCQDCGEPIDLRRLSAMPAAPYCTPCQSVHEHLASPSRY
jgi:DnaK suppressor protein